ncbi:replication-relaxation family protein [Priestia sp. J2]|uniref:replication-relaxation family protein n=1 Tax=Priestia sp. J2 TaxID=2886505 RepID=UPI001E55A994|nr:replication-relaxation family protein [Priestia sp. J2]
MQKYAKREQKIDAILQSLKTLNYLSRSQIQTLHDLKGDRNAQKFLKSMDEYLNSFRDGETIYYLSKEGRERVDCPRVIKKTTTARHYIMRNALYIAFSQPETWKNEQRIKHKIATIVCDATFVEDNTRYLIEIDHEQKMNANRTKMEKYRKLIEINAFGKSSIQLVWMTTTEYRRKQLEKLCEGLNAQIFMITDFQ